MDMPWTLAECHKMPHWCNAGNREENWAKTWEEHGQGEKESTFSGVSAVVAPEGTPPGVWGGSPHL